MDVLDRDFVSEQRFKVAITGLDLNARRSNKFGLLFEALQLLRSLNKDSDEFCQALQDGRGDSKSFVKSCKTSPSHGASDDQAIASLFVKSCKPSPSHGASGSIQRADSHFRATF